MKAGILTNWWNAFTGAGEYSVTVPPWDGPLHPNTLLEEAQRFAEVRNPDNLCVHQDQLVFSSGQALLALGRAAGSPKELLRFDHPITATASDGEQLAVALSNGAIEIHSSGGRKIALQMPRDAGMPCPTALLLEGTSVVVTNGSAENNPENWKRDLMEKRASGTVWRLAKGGQATKLASGLAFPNGLIKRRDGSIAVSESWRHRIIKIEDRGGVKALLADLPAYPGRLAHAPAGGYWLAGFAPRSQMVEFMLTEKAALEEMIATIHPDYWMAPRYASGKSFREPLQGGGIKQLGILKPWAPTQSYGLVVRLDEDMQPLESFHSRADGVIHGVTSCVEFGERLFAASKGAECLVSLELAPSVENAP